MQNQFQRNEPIKLKRKLKGKIVADEKQDKSEGTETLEGTETAAADAAKGSETETKQPAAEDKKVQQQIDQERANARRAREALTAAQAEKEELADQLVQTQQRLSELEGQLKEELTRKEYQDLGQLDPEKTDVPELIKAFQQATQKVAQLEERATKAERFIQDQAQRDEAQRQAQQRKQMEDDICAVCEEDYGEDGSKYRAAAFRRADELINAGEVDKPATALQGLKLMKRCYAEVAAQRKKPEPKKATVPTDTGLRGLSAPDLENSEEFKPGKYHEIAADMAKKMKAGKWKRAFATPP